MPRRLLITTTAYPPSTGGVQAHVAELRARLSGYEADVVTLWREQRTDWLLGTTLRLGEPEPAGERDERGVRRLGWPPALRARMLPWVLGYYGLVPLAAERLAALMAPELDRLVSPEHLLIHNHRVGREFLALASLRVARRRGLPFVLTPHHHPRWRGYRYSGWLRAYRRADAVLALTEAERRELERLGVQPARLHVIGGAAEEPPPAEPGRFRAGLPDPEAPLVLFLGQLYEYKGVAELFEAADALHDAGVGFTLAYAGPPTPFSERYFAGRARPWLRVLGVLPAQLRWDAIAAADAVCLPSRQEAFGRVYLEAWSLAKPVVGARIPAVEEVVEDGETGLLVEPGSSEQLARALRLLLRDEKLAARLGARGREVVAERHTWRLVAARVERAYEAALAAVAARKA